MGDKPIIELLAENERNVSLLYSSYAKKIPVKGAFWQRLADEEISHAQSLHDVSQVVSAAQSITENKFTRGVINYVMNFVLKEIQHAEKNQMTHHDALNIALRVERSILEKKCFEMLTPTGTTVKELFQKLNNETEKHIEMLMRELKQESRHANVYCRT